MVYCEMQARENTSDSRTYFSLMQHMYPGHCGYKVGVATVVGVVSWSWCFSAWSALQSETGGRLENLRTSCSNEKVLMCLVLCEGVLGRV